MEKGFTKKITIWGAGSRGKAFYECIGSRNVAAYIDNDKEKIGEYYKNTPIISFDDFLASDLAKETIILISPVYHYKDIENTLVSKGIIFWWNLIDEPTEYTEAQFFNLYEEIPFPNDREGTVVIAGSNLFAFNCYKFLIANGYKNVYMYTENAQRREYMEKVLECEFILDRDIISRTSCYVADSKEYCLLKTDGVMNIFDLPSVIDKRNEKDSYGLKNKYKNMPCFIIGNGPSLDVNDLISIKNCMTFGTNRIYKIEDTWKPDFYVCVDRAIFLDDKPAKYSVDMKFFSQFYKDSDVAFGNIYRLHAVLDNRHGEIPFSEDIEKCVYNGSTVSYTAIQLAVYMGFSTIYLLGMDCDYTPINGASHFYGKDTYDGGDHHQDRAMLAFMSAKKYADTHGIKIYNATRGGKLEVFERVDFDELNL